MSSPATTPLTVALPKGRLLQPIAERMRRCGLNILFDDRELITESATHDLRFILVRNGDLPIYVLHGIAGLGICGFDTLFESGCTLFRLLEFDFGRVEMCLACRPDLAERPIGTHITVATKFPRFVRRHFHRLGIATEIIHLNGSVELAPLLGLAPYIVDLVETGATLTANDLVVAERLARIGIHLVANPSYYKFYHKRVDAVTEMLRAGEAG